MNLLKVAERARLLEHDAKMRRPAKELFPRRESRLIMVCKMCGKKFERPAIVGEVKLYCGERCRDASNNQATGQDAVA